MNVFRTLITSVLLASSAAIAHDTNQPTPSGGGLKVLVYSNTAYYRHPDIPGINRWLVLLGHENGFEVDVTEHEKDMTTKVLERYDVLVLNNANELDKVLPEANRKAVENWFVKGKKGIVGLHAALVHQTNWPWLNWLGGCDLLAGDSLCKTTHPRWHSLGRGPSQAMMKLALIVILAAIASRSHAVEAPPEVDSTVKQRGPFYSGCIRRG